MTRRVEAKSRATGPSATGRLSEERSLPAKIAGEKGLPLPAPTPHAMKDRSDTSMLKGKVVLVTGSSSGIGMATARLAKSYGATPVIHGKTVDKDLKDLAKELGCEYIACDVSDRKAVAKAVKGVITNHGRIDALINSAGILPDESFLRSPDEEWLRIFQVNLLGTVHFCQEVVAHMLKREYGRIVNVSSQRGHSATANNSRMAYSASKAAVINLTASLAKEFAPHVLVNAVSPGHVKTAMSKSWSAKSRKQSQSNLLGRALEPVEIAEVLLFLASDRNSGMTGQTVVVDGGYAMAGK